MSASGALGKQWPRVSTEDGEYDSRTAPVSQHGMQELAHGVMQQLRAHGGAHEVDRVVEVPLAQLRASQPEVFPDHVRRLAGMPAAVFSRPRDLPQTAQLPDGTHYLLEGHHRVAAAHARGEDRVRVRVREVYHP